MPFSLLLQGYPTSDIPVAHVQGPVLQGMFLHLMSTVDPAMAERLHHEDDYRPYTLSPLDIGDIPPLRGHEPTPNPSQEGIRTSPERNSPPGRG